MKQLAFDFSVESRRTFDNFIVGRNAELVQRLRELGAPDAGERFFYLWGLHGSGRTHLLLAAVARLQATGVRSAYVPIGDELTEMLHECDAVAVDDVDRLDRDAEQRLFSLYNALREKRGTLIAAGSVAPMQLRMRADVVTRLGWGLVYEVHALSDAEKAQALADHALQRGFALPAEVSRYLLTHGRRDMPALVATIDALDRWSREAKRPVTVPLLRELLAERDT